MSAPRFVDPASMAAPGGHYSHAVCAGGLVYVSGQLPITADGHRLTGAPFEAQARQVLANVEQALLACGSSPSLTPTRNSARTARDLVRARSPSST